MRINWFTCVVGLAYWSGCVWELRSGNGRVALLYLLYGAASFVLATMSR